MRGGVISRCLEYLLGATVGQETGYETFSQICNTSTSTWPSATHVGDDVPRTSPRYHETLHWSTPLQSTVAWKRRNNTVIGKQSRVSHVNVGLSIYS